MRTGIALGSNMGDRLGNLREAGLFLRSLAAKSGPFLISHAYETPPVDCPPDSPAFLNAVVEIEYEGEIFKLLEKLQHFEHDSGRPSRRPKNAPRSIDLDILYCDNMTLSDSALIIPHPRITERAFVLQPLAEICPEKVLPKQTKTAKELLEEIPSDNRNFIKCKIM